MGGTNYDTHTSYSSSSISFIYRKPFETRETRDDFLLIRVGFYLEPVKKPLLFQGRIVDSEEQFS